VILLYIGLKLGTLLLICSLARNPLQLVTAVLLFSLAGTALTLEDSRAVALELNKPQPAVAKLFLFSLLGNVILTLIAKGISRAMTGAWWPN
jgi:hypothetical protein